MWNFSRHSFGVIDLRFSVLAEILMRSARIEGRDVLLAHFRGYNYLFGAAIPSGEPIPDPQQWSGRYRLANPGVLSEAMNINQIDLEAGKDRVHVNYELRHIIRVTPRLPALHMGDMRFYIPGLGTNMGDEFSLHVVGGERMLRYSNWVFVRQ